ncbi:hypothetical protein HPO96_37100 [Kribbella sandramycini]|uniref:Uncharacterized protein n=1 Tax=Kribbella sandramycini TaxID=60450 RepID=A0A7Y4L7N3_9ACTN|nr:hypothetical protein [Kribbella sandramycini]MBB6564417.1 hypothetical protein [Kribbella sandramycini]NOL45878.1 hypothetical protein [Kribbella sandramycini]
MGSRGRQYITSDTEYRGLVTEVGVRAVKVQIFDETEEEFEARKALILDERERRWAWRRSHWEITGYEDYERVSAHGPYSSMTSARRSVSRLLKSGPTEWIDRDDPRIRRVTSGKVQVGTVTWVDAE